MQPQIIFSGTQKKRNSGAYLQQGIIFRLQNLKLTAHFGYRDSFHDRQNKHIVNNDGVTKWICKAGLTKLKSI